MNEQQILDAITDELCEKHGCHTVILYGSRARGDATEASDYDILAIRDAGESFRDARLWNGVYLDLFVYSESQLEAPHAGMLDVRNGRILREKGDVARNFISRLEQIYLGGPEKLAADEIAARRTWYRKVLDRIRLGGIQGNVRRFELVPTLLEDYFTIRNNWYRGPKASFLWLKENKPILYRAFEAAFEPAAPLAVLEELVSLVELEFDKEAKPRAAKTESLMPVALRPDFIKNWREIQDPDNSAYPDSDELLSIGSPLGKKLGLTRIAIHHELLPPGRRTSWPHAESAEEEFGFVIEGHPDVWIDGQLHALSPGDAVGFPSGTGIAHTFINNTNEIARLIVVGERSKPENRIYYAKNPELQAKRTDGWSDRPERILGAHDGWPDRLRLRHSRAETSRLILEPVTIDHAAELCDLYADPLLHEFVRFDPPTLEQQKQRCIRWSEARSPDGAELYVNWVSRDKETGRVSGHFQAAVKGDRSASIGYVVARDFQGRGHAAEAMTAVFQVLRDLYGVRRVQAWTDTRNVASHRFAAKLGMTMVETIKDADFFKGQSSDEYVFAKDI